MLSRLFPNWTGWHWVKLVLALAVAALSGIAKMQLPPDAPAGFPSIIISATALIAALQSILIPVSATNMSKRMTRRIGAAAASMFFLVALVGQSACKNAESAFQDLTGYECASQGPAADEPALVIIFCDLVDAGGRIISLFETRATPADAEKIVADHPVKQGHPDPKDAFRKMIGGAQ